ncbi:carbohydrate ABC transporter permease [Streptomyces sp. NPDC021212]|uniref:carbohydrate ABC transporter permease n=1 Tax=Streptomyces sp. NPDC021212 TaxID=3365118 RepID=UPI0037B8F4B3
MGHLAFFHRTPGHTSLRGKHRAPSLEQPQLAPGPEGSDAPRRRVPLRESSSAGPRLMGIVLLAPALAAVLAVSLYPVLRTLWLSLHDAGFSTGSHFTGTANLSRLLGDDLFWNAWWRTVAFAFGTTLVETALGIGFALVLHQSFRGRGWARAAVLIPWAIPTVVTSRMFGWIFDGQSGVANYLLTRLHLTDGYINFLGDPHTALATIGLADIWKTTPFMALLVLAALQTVPKELGESAKIDGASPWCTFRSVTLPVIAPALLIAALIRVLDAFRVFDLPYVLTGGGPADSTETLSTFGYKTLFSGLELGYGSMIATAAFVTEVFIAAGFAYYLSRRYRALEG